jgi:hypothetical protein
MHSIPPCPLRQLCLRPQKRQRRIAAVAVTTAHCSFSCSCFSSLLHFSPTPSSCCFSSLAICRFSRLSQLATPRQRICRLHLGRNTGLPRRRWELGNGFRNSDCFGANSSVFRKAGEILFCPSLTEQWSQWPGKRHHIGTQYDRQLGKFDKARVIVVRAAEQYPQNEDLPPVLPKRKKRPYVNPIKRGSFEKKLRRRAGLVPVKPLVAPQNGLLVKKLIPVAHMVLGARATVLDGVGRLLKVIPVKACR